MPMIKLSNIPIRLFREYLEYKGLAHVRTSSGHEIWTRPDLTRPVVFQTHIEPIPEFVVKNNLRTIGATAKDFRDFVEQPVKS
jgi:hypothetical protein